MSLPEFIYVVCQAGAEAAARSEILNLPGLKLAFSRRGFLTFKVEPGSLPEKFTLPTTLARSYGWCLGKVKGTDANDLVNQVSKFEGFSEAKQLHIFQRETKVPGTHGFEPGATVLVEEIASLFGEHESRKGHVKPNSLAGADELVFDIAIVEPDEWWVGTHFASNRSLRWPGGVPLFPVEEGKISRAYFKLKEALQWSGIRIQANDTCVEIGSAPGGACELLLELGAKVVAVDPAELDEEIVAHPNLTHLRMRGREVKKKQFRGVRWLMADLNIAPNSTLDTVADIVSHDDVSFSGMILTLKLSDWKLVEQIPVWLKQVREMGFGVVRARQLAFNRQEFCLVAVKDKFVLRAGKRKSR